MLPDDHHDERASEHIEAFIEGPPRIRRSRSKAARPDPRRPRKDVPLDTRSDWDRALRHEDARILRYGRPASVLVVEVRAGSDARVDRIAQLVGSTVRHLARETDRVARVAPGRFHLLLPETTEREAVAMADRIRRTCAGTPAIAALDGALIRTAASGPAPGHGLAGALRIAEDRLAS